MKEGCVICGRPLKTGIKFCYVCRSLQHAGRSYHRPWRNKSRAIQVCVGFISYWILYLFGVLKGEVFKVLFQISLLTGIPFILACILRIRKDKSLKRSHATN